MADIRLAKPAAGASESVQCAPDARFVFDFPTTDATLAREGDNLNISFQDGSQLSLEGFYQEYNGENLPSFNIDGTEVAAADFFQAMNEPDLMPAAGPGTGTVANGARFHEWGDSALTGGITHLDGLDWGFSRAFEWEDHPNAVGYNDDDEWGWRGAPDAVAPNNPVTLTPEDPSPVPPGTTVPGDDPENPVPPTPGNQGIVPPGDVRLVDEAGLRDGDTVTVNGAMRVSAPDGLASIEVDGRVIWQNGHMVGDPQFATDEGYFHNFAYDAASGRLTYTYTLTEATTEHKLAGPDHIAHSLPLTVRDVDGDSASSNITIIIRDDTPEIAKPVLDAGEDAVYEKDTGNVVENTVHDTAGTITLDLAGLTLGADHGDGKSVPEALSVEVAGQVFTFSVTTDEAGNYSFGPAQEGPDNSAMEITGNREDGYRLIFTRPESDVQPADAGADTATSDTYEFNITVKDADADIAAATQTIRTNVKPLVGTPPDEPDDPDDPRPDPVPVKPGLNVSDVTVNEAMLDFGTRPEGAEYAQTATGSFAVTTHGEGGTLVLSITVDGSLREITIDLDTDDNGTVRGSDTLATAYGDLTVTGVSHGRVEYTFTLNDEYQHKAPGQDEEAAVRNTEAVETVDITLTDNIGHDVETGTLGVSIVDDIPEISEPELVFGEGHEGDKVFVKDADNNPTDAVEKNAVQDTAETITLDLKGLTLGADDGDGAVLPDALSVEVAGHIFTFAVTADEAGNYSFGPAQDGPDRSAMEITGNRAEGYQLVYTRPESHVQPADAGADTARADTYEFHIKVKDADGDIASNTQTIKTNVKPLVGTPPDEPDDPDDPRPDPVPVEPGLNVSDVTVNEAGLSLGSAGAEGAPLAAASGSFAVTTHGEGGTLVLSFPGAEKSIVIELNESDTWKAPVDTAIDTQYGTLTVTGVANGLVEYTYTLTGRHEHAAPAVAGGKDANTAGGVEHIDVTLTDNIGRDVETGTLGVSIVDDVPILDGITFDGLLDTDAGGTNYVDHGAAQITGTLMGLAFGADADGGMVTLAVSRPGAEEPLASITYKVEVVKENGKDVVKLVSPEGDSSLILNPDGSFTFTRPTAEVNDTYNDTYTFTATVVDQDHDTVTATATVETNQTPHFGPHGTPIEGDVAEIKVHESVLTGGSQHGSGEEGVSVTQSGTFSIDTHHEGGTLTLEWGGVPMSFKLSADDTWQNVTDETVTQVSNGFATFTVNSIENGEVSYTLTLTKAVTHGADDSNPWNEIAKSPIKMTLTDTVHEDVATGDIKVTVVDDATVWAEGSNAVTGGETFASLHDTSHTTHISFATGQAGASAALFKSLHLNTTYTANTPLHEQKDENGNVVRDQYGNVQHDYWYAGSLKNSGNQAYVVETEDRTVEITPTFVHYKYVAGTNGQVQVDHLVDITNSIPRSAKALYLTGEGLTVGMKIGEGAYYYRAEAWNGAAPGEISVGSAKLYELNIKTENSTGIVNFESAYGKDHYLDGKDTVDADNVSEAIAIDTRNGLISYGFDIGLGGMDANDRVLVTFVMTPANSSDDSIVKMVEITLNMNDPDVEEIKDDAGQILKYRISVPDGFTKVFVSALPKQDYKVGDDGFSAEKTSSEAETSGFIIKEIDFLTATYTSKGQVTGISADGMKSYDWNFADLKTGIVVVKGVGGGEYAVVQDGEPVENGDELTYTFRLGDGDLKDEKLFTATINTKTGEWSVEHFREFDMLEPGKHAFQINGTDTDDDTATIQLDITANFVRFANVVNGYYNPDWGAENVLAKDQADDILVGNDNNTLMYGKGGDDLLIGDEYSKEVVNGPAPEVSDTIQGYADTILGYKVTTSDNDANHNLKSGADGKTAVERLYNNIDALTDDEKVQLGNVLEAHEKKQTHGDDALYGGRGKDLLFGAGGDDYLSGDLDQDIIYGGGGNDIILYDKEDLYIDGGSDHDIIVGGSKTPGLAQLMANTKENHDGPVVRNVEMLLRYDGEFTSSLEVSSHKSLEGYGIFISDAGVNLVGDWKWAGSDTENGIDFYRSDTNKLTLEIVHDTPGNRPESGQATSYSMARAAGIAGEVGLLTVLAAANDVEAAQVRQDDAAAAVQEAQAADGGLDAAAVSFAETGAGAPVDAPAGAEPQDGFETLIAGLGEVTPAMLDGTDEVRDARYTALDGDSEAQIVERTTAADGAAGRTAGEGASSAATGRGDAIPEGVEVIREGDGDDVIDAGAGSHAIYAGAGDDLIVYDATDYLIDGGDGIDFLLSGSADPAHSLADMLGNWEQNGADKEMPMVHDVEVMLKGVDTTGLQNMDALAAKYGFSMGKDANGRDVLILGDQWKEVDGSANGITTTYENGDGITLETTLQATTGADQSEQVAQTIVLSSNG